MRVTQTVTNIIEKETNIINIFKKDDKATQDNVKILTDFLKDRFLVISIIIVKALAFIQIKELAQKKDKSFEEYYCRS
jgi:GTPase Era involved in 16S rRNA processing